MRSSSIAILAVFVLLTTPAEARGGQRMPPIFSRPAIATAYSGDPDIVTAYATGMARYRLQLAAGGSYAMALEPRMLRAEFRKRTWRAADGSLLQGFAGKGGFRLTLGDCLRYVCRGSECADDEWPFYKCSDGVRRKMVAVDFATAIFDGITYQRLLRREGAG